MRQQVLPAPICHSLPDIQRIQSTPLCIHQQATGQQVGKKYRMPLHGGSEHQQVAFTLLLEDQIGHLQVLDRADGNIDLVDPAKRQVKAKLCLAQASCQQIELQPILADTQIKVVAQTERFNRQAPDQLGTPDVCLVEEYRGILRLGVGKAMFQHVALQYLRHVCNRQFLRRKESCIGIT